MRPVSNRRSKAFCTAANDNWPGRNRAVAADDWPPRPSAEANGAVPEWLLRSLMVLACSAPIAALILALPWIRQLLDG
jgi:hypothetical protein